MTAKIKKVLCIVLSLIVCLGSLTVGVNAQAESSRRIAESLKGDIQIQVTTDKEKYKKDDTVIINLEVTNASSRDHKNIGINMVYNWFKIECEQGSDIEIDELKAGETKNVSFKVSYFRSFWARLLFPVFKTISWLFRNLWGSYSETTRHYIKIGGINRLFVFYIYQAEGDEEIENSVPQVEIKYNLGSVNADKYETTQKVEKGTIPEEPAIPTSDDYVFVGWFSDESLTQSYYFEQILSEDIELYAKWIPVSKEDVDFIKNGVTEKEISFSTENSVVENVTVDYKLEKGIGNVVIEYATGIINNVYSKIGEAVDITINGDDYLDTATISFKYDESKLPEETSEDDLGIVWYDEANKKMVLLENAIVDKENDTVSVETNHFSKYVVVNSKAWVKHWEHKQMVSRVEGNTVRFNIVLCLDDSGSMSGTAKNVCQQAARNFVDQLVDGDNIAVVKFNSDPTTLVPCTAIVDNDGLNNKETIKNQIVLKASGGTNFNKSLDLAISLLNSMPEKTNDNEILKNYIVFLSDGQSSVGSSQLAELVKWGYNVIAIGVGNNVSASELMKLASQSGGSYAHVSDPSQIDTVFEQVQGEFIGLSIDSDGDGIADLVEKTGMIATDGNIYRTDPNDADTDGDGRPDGVEIGIYNDANGCFEINSSPTTPTSDSAKYKLNFYVSPRTYNSTDVEDYKNIEIKAVLDVYGGHEFPTNDLGLTDYLSDVDYQDLKDVTVEILEDGKVIQIFKNNIIAEGTTSVNGLTRKLDNLKSRTYSVRVTTTNAGSSEKEISYAPHSTWLANINKVQEDAEKQMLQKATSAVRAYSNIVAEKEKAIENAFIIECMDVVVGSNQHYQIAETIAKELQKVMSQKTIDEAKYWAEKSGWAYDYDAEQVVKKIAERCVPESEEFDITVGKNSYDVSMNEVGAFEAAGFGTITVVNKATNEKFEFVFSSSPKIINSTIDRYMDECKVLYDKSLDYVIDQTFSDAKAVLGIDELEKLLKSKLGEHIDAVMSNNNKNLGFTFNEVKSCYEYYKKAKDAISNSQKDNTNTNQLIKTMKSVDSFITSANDL